MCLQVFGLQSCTSDNAESTLVVMNVGSNDGH